MKVYKIRDIRTGLFQLGGTYLCWHEEGKTWRSIGTLKSHITHLLKIQGRYGHPPADQQEISFWEVVEYELQEVGCSLVIEHMKKSKAKK